jgi:NADH dehydrogenase FAD-containing subunit
VNQGKEKHVVVLGAGFGGLTFCQSFDHPDARVTLVDRSNHHLFHDIAVKPPWEFIFVYTSEPRSGSDVF